MKGKVLLTGFESFGADDINPSLNVAKSLDGVEINGYQVVTRALPVEWGTAKDSIESLIDELRPVAVLSLGLAAGRTEISVEKVAINYTSKTKDNAGVIPSEWAIVPGEADAYFATIPVEQIADDICNLGVPARVSLTAGAYLCNYVLYCASRHVRKAGSAIPVGFIHVPATPEMLAGKPRSGPSMAESLIREAVRQALTTLTSGFTNCG